MSVNQEKNEQMGIKLRLKQVQKSKGMNLKQFSDASGVTYRSLQNYLSGEREPNVTGLTNLCTRLGVNINWLLTGQGVMFIDEKIDELSREEASIIDDFRSMNEQGKVAVKATARAMAQQELFKDSKVS